MGLITCHIATIPAREQSLRQVLNAIIPQVDKVYVSLNGYQVCPDWLRNLRNVECEILDNSLGDSAKVLHVNDNKGICLLLDDDLLVNSTYAKYLCSGVIKYNGLVSLHGRKYLSGASFKRWAGNYRCLGTVSEDVHVNLIGSGCCAFSNERLHVDISDFKRKNMADCFLSKVATEQGVPMIVLKHEAGYIRYLPPADGQTIWRTTTDYSYHTEILKSFIK